MTPYDALIAAADKLLWLANNKLRAAQRIWEWSGHGYDRGLTRRAQIMNNRSTWQNRDSQWLRKEARKYRD